MPIDATTFGDLLASAKSRFLEHKIGTPELDVRILLEEASGLSHAGLISHASDNVPDQVAQTFDAFVGRRLSGEPVYRILGWREFYGRKFGLNCETLVPRDDTETLIEAVLNAAPSREQMRILDVGTGSGVIAVTLACELEGAELVATDISQAALDKAAENAELHYVRDKIAFVHSDLFDAIEGSFDFIVSNPPYIRSDDISQLDVEVRDHDPLAALDGGDDGLFFYRGIFSHSAMFLTPDGKIVVEIGYDQAEAVSMIAREAGFATVNVLKDYSGNPRVIAASR